MMSELEKAREWKKWIINSPDSDLEWLRELRDMDNGELLTEYRLYLRYCSKER